MYIKLNPNNVEQFANIAKTFNEDINVTKGRLIVDGKSVIGLMSIDFSRYADAKIITDNPKTIMKFNEAMKQFAED